MGNNPGGANAGVVDMTDVTVNASPGGKSTDMASTWAHIWFGIAVTFLVILYFGLGGFRGRVSV